MVSCDQTVLLEQVCHPHQISDGDSVISPGVSGRGTSCFQSTSRMLTSRFQSPGFAALPAYHPFWLGLPVQDFVFQPFFGSTGLHQGVSPGPGVGLQDVYLSPSLHG